MKVSHISVMAVVLLVIAIAIAGCTSTQTSTTSSSGSGQAASASGTGASNSGGSSGSGSSGSSSVSTSDLFGGLSYNWVEYKISGSSGTSPSSSGTSSSTMYVKYTNTGACTIRFENPPQGAPSTIDCGPGATGFAAAEGQANPNKPHPGTQISCSGDESVTVPAGTFTATKCTTTSSGGYTSTIWVVKGQFLVKALGTSTSSGATGEMELNAYG